MEVVAVAAITGAVSYLASRRSLIHQNFRADDVLQVIFQRVQSSDLVANLFQECDQTKGDYHGLCK